MRGLRLFLPSRCSAGGMIFFNPSSEAGIHAWKVGRDLGMCGEGEEGHS